MITRLLVANRGEIARRVIATCQRLGVQTVAVHSDPDAEAPHVAEADFAVRLPGRTPAETYLRADLLIDAARRTGADAVHPGYGFLAENAAFAAAVTDAGLTWVGPPAAAIAAMGSKIEAKALLGAAGVPMLPSVTDPERVDEFPVLVKASAGGGGRGMRIVRDAAALPDAVAAARREAAGAFGDDTVFIERYLENARHVEVQIVGDHHGTVLALGERECSIQRRHQKIVEETPSPAVTPDLRAALAAAAVAAGRAVGYVGAGTVEFLLADDGRFHFLEMNTRLQVEHPVTECVTGLDLVRLQLAVAQGEALPAAPPATGHAIEVRLCAEDPAAGWAPATGTLHRFHVPRVAGTFGPLTGPGLRLDSGVTDGSVVGVHYDSLLAKLVAWAPTRAEAARLLADALTRAQVHGVTTNRDLLVRVLRHPAFAAGRTDTGFLDRHPEVFAPLVSAVPAADELDRPQPAGSEGAGSQRPRPAGSQPAELDRPLSVYCLAAALAGAAARRDAATVLGSLPSGWRNVPAAEQVRVFDGPAGPLRVGYRLDRTGALASWSFDGVTGAPPVAIIQATADAVVLDLHGLRLRLRVHRVGSRCYVDGPHGSIALDERPRFTEPRSRLARGSLVAPMPGTVSRVLVEPGQRVTAGELLLTLEAMKLEHPVPAPADGVVTALPVVVGGQVAAGDVLVVVAAEEPEGVATGEPHGVTAEESEGSR